MSRLFSKSDKGNKPVKAKAKHIDKLQPAQRRWSDQMLGVLGLPSGNSQARVLAGAIASAQVIEDNGTDQEKATAKQLRETVLAAGKPPWKDAEKAMAATAAKVNLDLLSMPANERELKPLGGGAKGVNESFWLNRRDANDDEQKSFLCKPAKKGGGTAVSGGVDGGEVAREALAGRAAQAFAKQTGIDINMPETHVVTLSGDMLPGGTAKPGEQVTCSVQEARHAQKDLHTISDFAKVTMSAAEVGGLAIYDTLTLNTDRHGGNVLVDPDGKLVPIDHGESFAEPNPAGIDRIKATLGAPHNALLKIPSAHSPMSKEMLKKMTALDPDKYAGSLKDDNKAVGKQHPDMKDAITPGAIDTARRAAMFVKLAAKNNPPLSPASIQVAMGNAADRLFGDAINEKTFLKNAKDAIDRIAPQQKAVKEICTAPDVEYNALLEQAKALGWDGAFAARTGAPDGGACADPIVLLTVVKKGIRAPSKRFADMQTKLAELQTSPAANETITPQEADEAVMASRRLALQNLQAAMPGKDQSALAGRMIQLDTGDKRFLLDGLALLLPDAIKAASDHQQRRIADIKTRNRVDDLITAGFFQKDNHGTLTKLNRAEGALAIHDPVTAKGDIDSAEADAQAGKFMPVEAEKQAKFLRELAQKMLVPSRDADLAAGLAAAAGNDPFTAKTHYDRLAGRITNGEFVDEPLRLIQEELDQLRTDYHFDLTKREGQYVTAAEAALQQRDPVAAEKALYEVRNNCKRGIFLPKNSGVAALVDTLEVPDDDTDLVALKEALAPPDKTSARVVLQTVKDLAKKGQTLTGDPTAALQNFTFDDNGIAQLAQLGVPQAELDELRTALTKPDSAEYEKRLKNLKDRSRKGEFGNGGLQKMQARLDAVTSKFDVPKELPALEGAVACLSRNEVDFAETYVEQVEKCAKAGMFTAKGDDNDDDNT